MLSSLERNSHRFGAMHVWLVGPTQGESHMIQRAKSAGIRIHHHPKSVAGFAAFRRFLGKKKIDIVHSHIGHPSGVYLRIARKEGVKYRLASWHNIQHLPANHLKKRLVIHLQKMVAKNGTMGFAVSDGVRNSLSYRPLQRLTQVLYNGYDIIPGESPRIEGPLRLIHVGRFHPQKNHQFLWEIASQLNVPFKLVACGRHDHRECLPDADLLRDIANKWKVDDASEVVSLPGNCNDVRSRMLESDILLFPSVYEGLGGVIIEAAALGCTCFVSDIAPHREIAPHFDNVHLLDISSGVEVWIKAIESFKREPVNMKAILNQFENSPFTVKHMDKRLFELYGMKGE
ncbi:MAG: glycosyltransferase [Oceanospirillaceae bacterium]|nr:glycosyltransferase [Oceanospirillaceae bacterium]